MSYVDLGLAMLCNAIDNKDAAWILSGECYTLIDRLRVSYYDLLIAWARAGCPDKMNGQANVPGLLKKMIMESPVGVFIYDTDILTTAPEKTRPERRKSDNGIQEPARPRHEELDRRWRFMREHTERAMSRVECA